MSVSNPDLPVSRQDLADFYDKIFPYLGGKANAGFTPVGTIISVMGVTAPANYLACDGTVYNIADYPELARYFGQQFSMVNKFGGNGTTTFAVPDLRGEFLRGTGTNSHTKQGNGADVGVHQDATENLWITRYRDAINSNNNLLINSDVAKNDPSLNLQPKNTDSNIAGRLAYHNIKITSSTVDSSQSVSRYTARPTNTSILWCIATKDIYLNPSLDYSTDEKVVGKWIDGKTLYQRTINFGTLPNATSKAVAHGISNLSTVVNLTITAKNNSGSFLILPYNYSSGSTENYVIFGCDSTNITIVANTDRSAFSGTATIQYTKA